MSSNFQIRRTNVTFIRWKVLRAFLIGLIVGPFVYGITFGTNEYRANLVTELMGIGFTALVIDWIYSLRTRRELRLRLVREAGSRSNDIAISAVDWLRGEGWLTGNNGALQGENMEMANLKKVNLSGANLRGAWLKWANLKQAHLHGADLSDSSLWKADLRSVYAVEPNLQNADLDRAIIQNALMLNPNMEGAVLASADLEGAMLPGAKFQEATLSGAELQGALLWNVDLREVDLTDINLKGALLLGAKLDGARLDGVILPDGEVYSDDLDLRKFTDKDHSEFEETLASIKEIRIELGFDSEE